MIADESDAYSLFVAWVARLLLIGTMIMPQCPFVPSTLEDDWDYDEAYIDSTEEEVSAEEIRGVGRDVAAQ